MKKISGRNKALLIEGLKATGSVINTFYYIEQSILTEDRETILEFCKWLEKEEKRFSRVNIDILFTTFYHT